MSKQNIHFKGCNYGGNSCTNNLTYYDINPGYSNQSVNCLHFPEHGIFTQPPPPILPNYHQMPPPPFAVPQPSLSVPPPPIIPQVVPERMTWCSESAYYGSEVDRPAQVYSSTSLLQPKHEALNVTLPTPNVNFLQEFSVTCQVPNRISSLPELSPADQNKPMSADEIDEVWIKNWLKDIANSRRGKYVNREGGNDKHVSSLAFSELKIHEVKDSLNDITRLLSELKNLCKSLNVMYKSLNDNEWTLRCMELEEKKRRLSSMLGSLVNNDKLIQSIKVNLNKRKKKRERQKRKREEWKKQKVESSLKRQLLHQNIDRWLENMKENVERGRRDDELKREADSVLADVTRKKTEAKRQIALLSALLRLREARVIAQKAIGKNISQPQTDAFNSIIERLKTLWTKQLKEYCFEEQGLKVMLNEAAAEEKNNEALKKREILRFWELAIFGDYKTSEFQPCNINEFYAVRKQWDQFVVDEGTVMSSSIPPGWVLPTKGSDINWRKFSETHETFNI